jgi:hypothetical protein
MGVKKPARTYCSLLLAANEVMPPGNASHYDKGLGVKMKEMAYNWQIIDQVGPVLNAGWGPFFIGGDIQGTSKRPLICLRCYSYPHSNISLSSVPL